jgi:formylglycine-generating enzyme required for sulfatase activity
MNRIAVVIAALVLSLVSIFSGWGAEANPDQVTAVAEIRKLGTRVSEEPKQPPKELTVDLGKGVKLEMVLIPAGEFLMGSPDSDKLASIDEKPQHRVRITKPFYLGKYLVTQEQWQAVMDNNPSDFKGPKNPVETVNWDDCHRAN